MILYKGGAHGVPLFERDPDLLLTLTAWFATNL